MNKYHERFINSFASENVIALFSRYKGAAKEITESWGMLEAAKKFIDNINDCIVVVVGDGCSPRTGILFSYYTRAEVVSVDPNANLDHWEDHCLKQHRMNGFPPRRIQFLKRRIEDIVISCKNKDVIVIWPHSHANMSLINLEDHKKRYDIAMPCCKPIPDKYLTIPHITYKDKNITSPKNIIHFWKDLI